MKSFGDNIRSQIKVASTLHRLLIANIALFAIIRIVNAVASLFRIDVLDIDFVVSWLAIPSNPLLLLYKPWTVFTYMFTHWEILHIFFNMLWLYWMGRIFQEYLGSKKLLSTYIMGGLFGAIAFIIAFNLFPLFSDIHSMSLMGASASVLAITTATATLLPEYTIILFLFGPVRLKWIAILSVFLSLISVRGMNPGGMIAHLGGAFYGYIFIMQLKKGTDLGNWLTRLFSLFSSRPKMKVTHKKKKTDDEYNLNRKARQERMDDILDKISKSGYGSLTQEEKDFLFKMSKED